SRRSPRGRVHGAMKRTDLVRRIEQLGAEFVRHGGKHDWYRNPVTGISQPVPRHREIPERLARHILRMLGSPPSPDSARWAAGTCYHECCVAAFIASLPSARSLSKEAQDEPLLAEHELARAFEADLVHPQPGAVETLGVLQVPTSGVVAEDPNVARVD